MDQISYAHSVRQARRIKKFIAEPDSTSGLVSVPKKIEEGQDITIPNGRVVVHPTLEIDGTLTIEQDGELFVPFGGTLVSSDLMHPVDTIADLRNETGKYKYVYVTGYHAKNDGAFGSHIFRLKGVKTTETDNGGTVIVATIGGVDYVYELQYDGAVNVKWFGAKGDGVTDDTVAIQNALAYTNNMYIPSGRYKVNNHIVIPSAFDDLTIYGDGNNLSILEFNSNTHGLDFSNVNFARPNLKGFSLRACSANCKRALNLDNYNYAFGNYAEIDISISAGGQNNTSTSGIWEYGLWANNIQSSEVELDMYKSCIVGIHIEGYAAGVTFLDLNIVARTGYTQRAYEYIFNTGSYSERNHVNNIIGGVFQGSFSKSIFYVQTSALSIDGAYLENSNTSPSDGADIILDARAFVSNIRNCSSSSVSGATTLKTINGYLTNGYINIDKCNFNGINVSTDGKASITNCKLVTLTYTTGASTTPIMYNNITGTSSTAITPDYISKSTNHSFNGNLYARYLVAGRNQATNEYIGDGRIYCYGSSANASFEVTPNDVSNGSITALAMRVGGTAPFYVTTNGTIHSVGSYNTTTASGANVVIESSGRILRSSSSSKYKKDIEDVSDIYVDNFIENARPIWYRSLSEYDNSKFSYWGFIAEELAEIDPRLVIWKHKDTKKVVSSEYKPAIYDEDGNTIEEEIEEKYIDVPDEESELEAEGVMYDRITVILTSKIQKQEKLIKELINRIELLELK